MADMANLNVKGLELEMAEELPRYLSLPDNVSRWSWSARWIKNLPTRQLGQARSSQALNVGFGSVPVPRGPATKPGSGRAYRSFL